MIFTSPFPDVPLMERSIADELLEAIWKHGTADPQRPAFIVADTDEHVTYRQLYLAALSVASYLKKELDFGRGDLACAVTRNCWEYFALFFGCGLCGGGLSGASPLFTDFELHRQFADSRAKLVVCMESALPVVVQAAKNCPNLKQIVIIGGKAQKQTQNGIQLVGFEELLQTQPNLTKTNPSVDLKNDVVFMPYSSGTTGPPKGVMQGNYNYGAMLRIAFYHYDQQVAKKVDPNWRWQREHIQLALPFYHNFGFTITLVTLLGGATGVIIRKYRPHIFLKTIQDYKIRINFMVPPMIVLLAKSELVHQFDLSSLIYIQTGAAPLGREIIDMVQQRLPNIKQISQGYGMTELSFGNHLPIFGDSNPNASGKLLANCQMKIKDLETGTLLGINQPGEIYVKGPIRMIGYFGRPEATREAFDEEGFVKTGDVGQVDETGQIYIVDRIKELIKVKGYQVAPAELEALLLTNDRIKDCAIFGVPHATSGETPKAFVVRGDPSLTEQEVIDYVKVRAAPYKHLHGGVEFIDQIPKSPSGKILRRKLRDAVKSKL